MSGTDGYDESVEYVDRQLQRVGYDTTIQAFDFVAWRSLGPSTFQQTAPTPTTYVEGTQFAVLQQSDPGDVTAPVTAVDLQLGIGNTSTSGCEAADFAGFPTGNIALIQRGTCPFEQKVENAAAAGAVGAIIMNQGNTAGADRQDVGVFTLGSTNESGIPAVFVSYTQGVAFSQTAGLVTRIFVEHLPRGPRPPSTSWPSCRDGNRPRPSSWRVPTSTPSVLGPASTTTGLAAQPCSRRRSRWPMCSPTNDVRFAWWGAEESNLVGSNYYVANLTEEEQDAIALYLNFDMVGSPNYVRFVYDGDGSGAPGNPVGPPGSDEIEALFVDFYADRGLASDPTPFNGRSDYGPFIAAGVGIPAGVCSPGPRASRRRRRPPPTAERPVWPMTRATTRPATPTTT